MNPSLLRACPLFASLTPSALARVAELARPVEHAAGDVLFREGDPGDAMYVVLSGKVRVSKLIENVGEEALAVLEPGAFFGEMALIDESPRSADARAHAPCRLAVLRREDLEALLFVDKELAHDLLWAFARTLSARLRETNDKIRAFFVLSKFN